MLEIPYRKRIITSSEILGTKASEDRDGFIKLLIGEREDEFLGIHLISDHAGDTLVRILSALGTEENQQKLIGRTHINENIMVQTVKEAYFNAHCKDSFT